MLPSICRHFAQIHSQKFFIGFIFFLTLTLPYSVILRITGMIHMWPQIWRLRTKRILQSQLGMAGVQARGYPGGRPRQTTLWAALRTRPSRWSRLQRSLAPAGPWGTDVRSPPLSLSPLRLRGPPRRGSESSGGQLRPTRPRSRPPCPAAWPHTFSQQSCADLGRQAHSPQPLLRKLAARGEHSAAQEKLGES